MSITGNVQTLMKEIPAGVTVVLAAKTRTADEIREALDAGAVHFGHNYVQEAEHMITALGDRACEVVWHMIGGLQTNKINKALQLFDWIQTIDSPEKARAVNIRAGRIGKSIPVLIEINIGGEAAKAGFRPDSASLQAFAAEAGTLEHLHLKGLMTMGPLTGNPEDSRPHFRHTRRLFDELAACSISGVDMQVLSMGMSDSYRVALEEGATMVRIGTAVFGRRS